MNEELKLILTPFVGECNDTITRQKIIDVLGGYISSKQTITDITTPEEIDANIVSFKYSDLFLDRYLTVRILPNSWLDYSISVEETAD